MARSHWLTVNTVTQGALALMLSRYSGPRRKAGGRASRDYAIDS